MLFAAAYVALQVGRNLAAAGLLTREHALRLTLERIACWSVLSGGLWIAGALADGASRLAFWGCGPGLSAGRALPVCRASATLFEGVLGAWRSGL